MDDPVLRDKSQIETPRTDALIASFQGEYPAATDKAFHEADIIGPDCSAMASLIDFARELEHEADELDRAGVALAKELREAKAHMPSAIAESELHAPVNHEREPHCIGCWVVSWTENGGKLVARCNECGETRDLTNALMPSSVRETPPWKLPVRYDHERGYIYDANDVRVCSLRVSATEKWNQAVADAINRAGNLPEPRCMFPACEAFDGVQCPNTCDRSTGEFRPPPSAIQRSVTDEMVERALEAAVATTINFRPPWHADERATVRRMLEAAAIDSGGSKNG